ncbi:hypothetical protein TNCV_2942771 [Trichonephila clavipes]|nr:hypothetical protein TNCV_2942771 [Trichonephila clavipes]
MHIHCEHYDTLQSLAGRCHHAKEKQFGAWYSKTNYFAFHNSECIEGIQETLFIYHNSSSSYLDSYDSRKWCRVFRAKYVNDHKSIGVYNKIHLKKPPVTTFRISSCSTGMQTPALYYNIVCIGDPYAARFTELP